jgi:hypothetical protein
MNVADSSRVESHETICSRIRTIGKAGRILCSFILVLVVVNLILGASCPFMADTVFFQAGAFTIDGTTGLLGKAAVIAAEGLLWVFLAFAVWMARRLFANFARDEVLTSANGRLLRWMGAWCFVAAIVALAPDAILFGLFLHVLGWVMELAASVKQEHDLTI